MSRERPRSDHMPTVVDRFLESLERQPDAVAVTLVEHGGEAVPLTYEDLYREACRAAAGLRELGVGRGDRIVVALPTSRATLGIYLGALMSGVIPVMIPAPRGSGPLPHFARRLAELAQEIEAAKILVPESAVQWAASPALAGRLMSAEDLLALGERFPDIVAVPEGIAHLQTTSGATGVQKVAIIRHKNISANVAAIGRAIEERPGDLIVSWLPLYHDMGLICISCVLFWGRPLVLTETSNFVRHPVNYWLRLISRFGGTVSPAPTSAYQVCSRLASRRKFADLDLSAWRVAFCGAEPVHRRVIDDFQSSFAPHGLPATTLLPVYGLAESTLAATIPSIDIVAHSEEIELEPLMDESRAVPARTGVERTVTMVSVGSEIRGHRVEVTGPDGKPLPERHVGEVKVAGPSVIDGYWGDGPEQSLAQDDDLLATGDLGYLADGQLFVTGRRKEIILVRGRNLLASQIEAALYDVVETGGNNSVAALGLWSESAGTEELHLLLESRIVPPRDHFALEEKIRSALEEAFEITGATVHWVGKGEIPKTSSGKIQRHRLKELLASDR